MIRRSFFASGFMLAAIALLFACKQKAAEPKSTTPEYIIPELIVYCENGVSAPLDEISRHFEVRYNCKVTLHNGNIQNLVSIIEDTGKGDLFIPDSHRGFDILRATQPDIILDTLYIGTNRMTFIVPIGNPEEFDGALSSMREKKHVVIIANPETSSLGQITRDILNREGIYSEVVNNSVRLSVDNRAIIRSIYNGEATLGIDWLSSYYYNDNRDKADTIRFNPKKPEFDIYASVLRISKNPGLAHTYLAMLSSPYGAGIFELNGISRKKQGVLITSKLNYGNSSNKEEDRIK